MDALRIRRFKDRALAARRRIVAVGVVAALATISLIGSTAQAVTPAATGTSTRCLTQEELFAAQCILVAKLLQAANKPDLSPRDMQLAAPGGVIAATSTTPRDVNRWRPNPQTWIDEKNRVAGSAGLSDRDIASTSRWAPKLAKGVGLATLLGTGADLAWYIRDGWLQPALGLEKANEDFYCTREPNFATDLLGNLTNTDCPSWRLKQDYRDLVQPSLTERLVLGGRITLKSVKGGDAPAGRYGYGVCYIDHVFTPPNTYAGLSDALRKFAAEKGIMDDLTIRVEHANAEPSRGLNVFGAPCASGSGANYVWGTGLSGNASGYAIQSPIIKVDIVNKRTGEVVEPGMTPDSKAEFLTRVDCSDGRVLYAVSESFQQASLGVVYEPESVQLGTCVPVSTSVGIQSAGTGVPPSGAPASPWNPEPAPGDAPKPGTTTVTPPAEVPQEVKDWMTNFPQCWDGSCRLTLKKVTESTTEVDCFTVPAECVDWYEESASNPTKYKCYYAGESRALSDCFVYSRVFDKGKVQEGTGYGDPATGGDPGTGTGTKTNPGAAVVAMREPVQNPSGDRQCWPTGWAAFNPFEWVFQPVRCALEWAFVPREAKLVQVQTAIKLAATNSRPGEMVQSISGWADAVSDIDPSGCAGPAVNLNLMGIVYSGHPLSACAEPAATLAWWSKLIIGVSVALAAALAITRYLGLQFGFSGVGRSPGGDS